MGLSQQALQKKRTGIVLTRDVSSTGCDPEGHTLYAWGVDMNGGGGLEGMGVQHGAESRLPMISRNTANVSSARLGQ